MKHNSNGLVTRHWCLIREEKSKGEVVSVLNQVPRHIPERLIKMK